MKQELQIELVERVLRHIEHRTTDVGSACGTAAVHSYINPLQLEREHARIFRRVPLLVGHTSMIAAPGDFFTLTLAGVPLLVVRGDDGRAHTYLNVCRHRGTCVEPEAAGCGKKSFTCPYHGWTYARDGRLTSIPHSPGFPVVEPGAVGLIELPCEDCAGFLFAKLSPATEPAAVPESFAAIEEDLLGWNLPAHHLYARSTFEKAINWKLAIDIFLEAYHLRTVHAGSIYEMFYDNLSLVDPLGPHTRNIFVKRSIRHVTDKPRADWRIRDHANVLYHLFPNTMLLFEPDHVAVMIVHPLGTDSCRIDSLILVPAPATSMRARVYWDANVKILYDAIAEDFAMGESIQRGFRSGANQSLTFGLFEHALSGFHAGVAALVGNNAEK